MPKHPLHRLPITKRIDATLATLSAMDFQESGGWSLADLAELCGCSEAAIVARQQAAMDRLRAEVAKHPDAVAILKSLQIPLP